MKKTLLVSSLFLASCLFASAATVHQTATGSSAYKGDGSSALESGLMESKVVENAKVARIKGDMSQWGYVTYWMGRRTPAGTATVRIRIYNTAEPVAGYALYLSGGPNDAYGQLTVPAGTAPDTFVDVDIPVALAKEWSGIVIKKTTKDALPGPWIESVTVLLD